MKQTMRYMTATDAKQRLAALLDAAQREPVMIRRQKRGFNLRWDFPTHRIGD